MVDLLKRVLSLIPFILVLSGCAAWPTLEGPDIFDPTKSTNIIPCSPSGDWNKAKKCAEGTLVELNDLLIDTGKYQRGMAYAATSIGTIVGGILAFDGSDNWLKGMAVVSGGLLGMNAVVKPDQQRLILQTAYNDMLCALEAASALHEAKFTAYAVNQIPALTPNMLDTFIATVYAKHYEPGRLKSRGTEQVFFDAQLDHIRLTNFNKRSMRIKDAAKELAVSSKSAPWDLGAVNMRIRANVHAQLAGLVPSFNDANEEVKGQISSMLGKFVKKMDEIPPESNNPMPGPNAVKSKVISFIDLSDDLDKLADAEEQIKDIAAPIRKVFERCVPPSVQNAITQ
ncbi:MAG: hypothetical protein ABW092_07510 [Candidatus Thiodiazotropha sp.]